MDASSKPKPSKNVAGELVYSTEDTNRVRVALGLRPLSTADTEKPSLPAFQTISKNGEISCSVAETNKLRVALGLRPLQTSHASQPSASDAKRHQSTEDGHALKRRLQKARAARAARTVMAPLSISEELTKLEPKGASLPAKEEVVPVTVKKRKRDDRDTVQLPTHLENELGLGQHAELTLRDKHVLDDDGSQPFQRADQSRKHDGDSNKDSDQSEIDGMNYDGTDTVQFRQEPQQPKNATSHNIERSDMIVDDDFDKRPAFSKRKRSKRRRKRVAEEEQVTKGHLKALRLKEEQKNGDESENDDEYYQKMDAARRKAKREDRDRIAKQILERVDHSDSEKEEDALVAFSEMEKISVDVPITDRDEKEKLFTSAPQSSAGASRETVVQSPIKTVNAVKTENLTNSSTKNFTEITSKPALAGSGSVPTAEEVHPSETNGLTGLAATLKRLRQTGVLHRKPEQVGRARDERFNDSDEESAEHGKTRVKLSYTDEFGNKLTPKEAYRLLSHKFHGNAPKQNKREKRLQKVLEKKRNAS